MPPEVREHFSEEERELLSRYFTNLDGPVFALVNLPEVVKGALFARYSRSAKSLRRLFIDEFVGDLDVSGDTSLDATVGLRRAEELYERVFSEYGDDSVAQLGGVHLACEYSSNLLTKVLERGRLMSYLEQSTRYVPYDSRLATGHYRYIREPDILESPLGARYVGEMDRMFDTYGALLPVLQEFVSRRSPAAEGVSAFAHRSAVRATCLDALRGLLPAGALSNVGIYGTGQGYEQLILRMRASALPEATRYAELMLEELRKVIPSFLTRLERVERGGVWVEYFRRNKEATHRVVSELFPAGIPEPGRGVTLTSFDGDGENRVAAAICFESSNLPEAVLREKVATLGAEDRRRLFAAYVGERRNRRHHPGRAFEATSYRFEVVCDYGAFRDLQRHRLLTIEWQKLNTDLGFDVPEIIEEAGLTSRYCEQLERSKALHDALAKYFPEQCAYAVALAYNVRFSIEMNAREAMHLIELRSGAQGHPSYRQVATDMYRLIRDEARHGLIAEAMGHVDFGDKDLGRLEAEQRAEAKKAQRSEATSSSRPSGRPKLRAVGPDSQKS